MDLSRPDFWTRLDEVVASYNIILDRPKGTPHPRYPDLIYPVNYGYLDGTAAMDGDGIDIWLGTSGFAQVDGVVFTVDSDQRDMEIKILFSCTNEEMSTINEIMNTGSMSGLMVRRPE